MEKKMHLSDRKSGMIACFTSGTKVFLASGMIRVIPIVIIVLAITSCGGGRGNADPNAVGSDLTETAARPPATDIHTAVFMDNLDVVAQHIKAGTALDTKDEYGSTPLMIAVTFNRLDVARSLIEAGADVNCKNNDGSTPLHTAAFLCRTDIVEMLLENGADRNIRNNFGSTALESIEVPFENVTEIYDQFSRDLGPLGLKLDYDRIRETRPLIAEMLR